MFQVLGFPYGYWNKDELTCERFLQNPFDSNYTMYKTGDVAILRHDGNLEFVGRTDGQVKLHGLRIELKEIERNILNNQDVSDVVVLVRQNTSKQQVLVAYITTYNKNFDVNALYEDLRKKLPFYMLPTIVKLDSFPLTPNGKIDKNSLPLPTAKIASNELPKTELENDILTIVKSVLNVPNFGVCDDLFTDRKC